MDGERVGVVPITSFGAFPGTRAFDRCAVRLFHVAAKHITPNDGIGNSAPREVRPAADRVASSGFSSAWSDRTIPLGCTSGGSTAASHAASSALARASPVPRSLWIREARSGQAAQHGRQGHPNVAENEMLGIRDAVGMRRRLPFEDVNRAPRMQVAQMVVGPSIAKAQLEDRSFNARDPARRGVQAGPLGLQPPDEAVQPAHYRPLGVLCCRNLSPCRSIQQAPICMVP